MENRDSLPMIRSSHEYLRSSYGEAKNEDIHTIMNRSDSVINRMTVVGHRVFSRQVLDQSVRIADKPLRNR